MCIDRDIELITCSGGRWRCASGEGKADTGRCRHASYHCPGGYRCTAAGQGAGIQLKRPWPREFQDRSAFREKALVIGSVGHRGLTNLYRRTVTRSTRAGETVWLCRQLETVTRDDRVRIRWVITCLERDIQCKGHPAEIDVGTILVIRIELTTTTCLGSHVVA
ncbi:hypothetical protein D3C73_881150 [compost metagenome]